jgi:hypothetical protein
MGRDSRYQTTTCRQGIVLIGDHHGGRANQVIQYSAVYLFSVLGDLLASGYFCQHDKRSKAQ